MTLANYINDLLYRYDCVIVPEFGGFVTNAISARVNVFSHSFYPPTKQITFNSHLKNNDGLLANYVASSENLSFEKAVDFIASSVKSWNEQLQHESLLIGKIGSLSFNKEQQLVFEPNQTTNYLTSSFGLSSLSSPAVKRVDENKLTSKKTIVTSSRKAPVFLKYAATAAVFLTVGTLGWNNYNLQQQKQTFAKQQKQVEKKIQSATFVIGNPLPTIELNLTKATAGNFHIIAGAYQFPENAEKKLQQLKEKGFEAKILGKNKWNLIQVAFNSFSTRVEATKNLKSIRDTYSKDAWLLIKKID